MLGLGIKAKFLGLDLGLEEEVLILAGQGLRLTMYCRSVSEQNRSLETNPE